MRDLTEAGLVELARSFYPTGYPATTDDDSLELHPYQRTPEYVRWSEAWDKAMAWPAWKALLSELRTHVGPAGDCTTPWMAACRRCCLYVEKPMPDGGRRLIRVAAAVSILAPLYVTYCTTEISSGPRQHEPQFSFEPPEEARELAARLAAAVERVLGYQPFPVRFASVPVPGIRVAYHHDREEPTLLEALFDDDLAHLP